jgi:hypothetical protein
VAGRQLDGHEVELATWTAAQAEDWLGRWAMNLMLINVSTRKLKRAVFSYFSPERRQQLGASSHLSGLSAGPAVGRRKAQGACEAPPQALDK